MESGVFRVVAANQCALFCLSDRALDWLAHFCRHQPREIVLLCFQNFRRASHHRLARCEGGAAVGTKSLRGELQFFVDLSFVEGLKSLERFARSWID